MTWLSSINGRSNCHRSSYDRVARRELNRWRLSPKGGAGIPHPGSSILKSTSYVAADARMADPPDLCRLEEQPDIAGIGAQCE
jgi:hypothetical protein